MPASYQHLDHRPLQLFRVDVEGAIYVVAPDRVTAKEVARRHVSDEDDAFALTPFLLQGRARASLPRTVLAAVPWGDPGPSRNVSAWLEEAEKLEHAAAAAAEIERVQVKFPFAQPRR